MSGAGPSKAVVEAVSGSAGSVLALLATYPLKTIYTLQALSTGSSNVASHVPSDTASKHVAVLRFLQTYKLSSLYAGLGPNIVESALSSGVYFFFYAAFRERAVLWKRQRDAAAAAAAGSKGVGGGGVSGSSGKDIGVLASLLVATAAGACNQLITMPASVVATRMQGYQSLPGAKAGVRPPTTWETISSVLREDGVGGFWKGLLPSMILLANPAVQYMLYEKILAALRAWKARRQAATRAAAAAAVAAGAAKDQAARAALARRRSADSDDAMDGVGSEATAAEVHKGAAAAAAADVTLSAAEVFLAGALAKIGATVATYPLIVVKARLQASTKASTAAAAAAGSAAAGRASTWGIISHTAANEGLGGFFKGLRAKILQTALNAALMLMLKEQLHGVTKRALMMTVPPPVVVVAAVRPAAA